MAGKTDPERYTKPALRERLKDRITKGTKGGRANQWSARKAQLLAHEYEKAGGGYRDNGHKSSAQTHLDEWTAEHWKTADGKPAKRKGGAVRYLPEKAWDELTPAQRKATNAKKRSASRKGKQFVSNTAAARKARRASTAH